MRKDNNTILNDKLIEKIFEEFDAPLFSYEEIYDYKELLSKFKKNPCTLPRIILFLIIFSFLIFCYLITFFTSNNIKEFSFFIIILIFIISLICTITYITASLKNLAKKDYKKIYFYDTYLIEHSKNKIKKLYYGNISVLKESNNTFIIISNQLCLYLKKDKINKDLSIFLKKLKEQYKNIQIDNNLDKDSWNFLDKYTNNSFINYTSILNESLLFQYYHTQNVYKNLFISRLSFIYFIITILFLLKFPINVFSSIIEFTFAYSFILLPIFVFFKSNFHSVIDNKIKEDLKKKSLQNLYFFNNFLLIQSNNSLIKYEYSEIKFITENETLIFIKVKNSRLPLIIEKKQLKDQEISFLKSLK